MGREEGVIIQADAANLPLADKSVDLVFGSPPYCDARDYGIGADRECQEWIDWMLTVTTEALRVCRGAVVWVAAGVTRDRNYWPACEGLMYEWWKRGGSMYRPCYWHRVGIPGSGGDQWFRANVEYVMCFKDAGPLPWADNTACGHTPKFFSGGQCSNRTASGGRCGVSRRANGRSKKYESTAIKNGGGGGYALPEIANPGNLIHTNAGGGHLGASVAHENEAPFPEKLAEFFVLSLCQPGGTVLDPFSGSGTTAAVAQRHGRKFIASDIRESQCELTRRRLEHNQLALL